MIDGSPSPPANISGITGYIERADTTIADAIVSAIGEDNFLESFYLIRRHETFGYSWVHCSDQSDSSQTFSLTLLMNCLNHVTLWECPPTEPNMSDSEKEQLFDLLSWREKLSS